MTPRLSILSRRGVDCTFPTDIRFELWRDAMVIP
jgi:hypothetical protein